MRETVKRLYADNATIFGTPLDAEAIVRLKEDWFARFDGWSLALEPGSLTVTPRGERRADAVFAMRYDYAPRDRSAPHVAGRARVRLGLVMGDAGWRIASETSEALP
jgi:hypothetical protein